VLLDQEDAASYKEGEEVTLLRWGNVTITAIERGADGRVTAMTGTHDPAATNFSKTKKATWIADVVRTVTAVIFLLPSTRASRLRVITLSVREFLIFIFALHSYLQPQLVPCKLVEFDHIISKAKLTEEDRFQDYVNPHTKFEVRLRNCIL
jgi:glutamyl-tRNA synthetase